MAASKYAGSGKKKLTAQVAFVGGCNVETLAAGVTMDSQSSNFQVLNPNGSDRTIVLPAEEPNDGLWFSFRNSGSAGNLVINDDAAATILTLNPGESGFVGCNGAAWAKVFEGTPALADFGSTGMKADVVAESTATVGVTVDGLLLKDGYVFALDNQGVKFGTGADIVGAWDGTRFSWTQAAANSEMRYGIDGAGIDQIWYGDTASANMTWDQSADKLIVNGAASIQGLRTSSSSAAAITTTRVLTLADAGGVFSVAQSSAYDVDVPDPTTGPGCRYVFYVTAPGAFNVTITCAGAATFVGTIVNDVTSVIPATGNTLTIASGVAALGDSIEIVSISTSLYLVRAVTSAAGGITVA